MSKSRLLLPLIPVLLAAGCQSQTQILDSEQGIAVQTAVRRGQFELGCPAAAGSVLSTNLLQPVLWRGQERTEYIVGVAGCGKRATYAVVCPLESSGCFAALGAGNPVVVQ